MKLAPGVIGMRLVSVAVFVLLVAATQAQPYYQRIWSFGPTNGAGSLPRGPLMEASDGRLYGTTYGGGSNDFGSVFTISKSGQDFNVLYSFGDAYFPCGGLVESTNGTLWSTTASGFNSSGTIFRLNKDGSGFAVVHTFPGFAGDGTQPVAGLVAGPGGVLYGTTQAGGISNAGTIFSIQPDGNGYTVRHSFTGASGGADGSSPAASLYRGVDGAFYGTTQGGGSNNLGTIFTLNPDGTGYRVLHHFSGGAADGRMPYGGLTQGQDGKLYGTTYYGGASDVGTVFSLGTNGLGFTVLTSFPGGNLGNQPFAGVVQGMGGRLYGTTRLGGPQGGGTVFALNTDGSGYAVVHSFSGAGGEGTTPLAALLVGSDGALYGSTYWGGDYATNNVSGTLFKLFNATPPVILSEAAQGSNFQVNFTGPAGQPYTLLACSNLALPLTNWTVLTNGVFSGPVSFTDTNAAANPARFYRVRSP